MARDPPSLLASSELRDLPLEPSAVRNARVTIIHPQLRDLILPLERGRVLYPRGNGIEEMQWRARDTRRGADEDEDEPMGELEEGMGHKGEITGTTRPFAKLTFTPNCLTASRGVLAAGGQHGEMYICDLPQPGSRGVHTAPLRPFHLSQTLPTRSINNSILILPSHPDEWADETEKRRLGYVGRGSRSWEEEDARGEYGARVEGGEWLRSSWREESETDDDEAMEIDDDFEPPSSPATYPNTVPFLHAPRIPGLASPPPATAAASTRRLSSSSSIRAQPIRATRQSFSAYAPPRQPEIQIVSSLPGPSRSASVSHSARPTPPPRPEADHRVPPPARRRAHLHSNEPRILVSNNDQTVKVFALRPPTLATSTLTFEAQRTAPAPPRGGATAGTGAGAGAGAGVDARELAPFHFGSRAWHALHPGASGSLGLSAERDRLRAQAIVADLPPPPTFFGGTGWDSIGMNAGIRAGAGLGSNAPAPIPRLPSVETRRHERSYIDVSASIGQRESDLRSTAEVEERKLSRVGGARFKYAINHSSVSPDLRTLVSVGDSTDVYLFEILDGGREFRKIRTYSAATDSGFSTAWSKDGRKFAVASQDGQVTVWDHRSSHPLAIFHTSSEAPSLSHSSRPYEQTLARGHGRPYGRDHDRDGDDALPSFTSDLSRAHAIRGRTTRPTYAHVAAPAPATNWIGDGGAEMVLVDPITGDARAGGSSSGREAARVVKFSPEGSERDLMVFSEENSHIHIIDAKTFHSHVVLPVPAWLPGPGQAGGGGGGGGGSASADAYRAGAEGGTWGVAGVAFDPTGDFLYAGTERTVVEWDMRRVGSGGAGTWSMA